jgi:hypothetical protein
VINLSTRARSADFCVIIEIYENVPRPLLRVIAIDHSLGMVRLAATGPCDRAGGPGVERWSILTAYVEFLRSM